MMQSEAPSTVPSCGDDSLNSTSWPLRRLPAFDCPPVNSVAATADITQMSLEQLMDVSIYGASKYEQKQSEVAAAVSVITRSEIKAFGWRTLDAALSSLPGIYTTYDRSYVYVGTRGFGLPGDYNTRLLPTINMDVVQNKIMFEANLGAARKARLKFSSKLLNLAREVWQ